MDVCPVAYTRGAGGPGLPIFQTKHKHTFKLHEISQFGHFILGKIIKIVATGSHLLKLKCIKFDFGPDPTEGAHGASPGLLARF